MSHFAYKLIAHFSRNGAIRCEGNNLYGVFPWGKGICCLLRIHILVSVTLLIKSCLPQLLFWLICLDRSFGAFKQINKFKWFNILFLTRSIVTNLNSISLFCHPLEFFYSGEIQVIKLKSNCPKIM